MWSYWLHIDCMIQSSPFRIINYFPDKIFIWRPLHVWLLGKCWIYESLIYSLLLLLCVWETECECFLFNANQGCNAICKLLQRSLGQWHFLTGHCVINILLLQGTIAPLIWHEIIYNYCHIMSTSLCMQGCSDTERVSCCFSASLHFLIV